MMMDLEAGEVLEVITYNQVTYGILDKYVKDDDYTYWLRKTMCEPFKKRDDDDYTYWNKHRRLLNVVSHKRFLIHYFGCVETKEKTTSLLDSVHKVALESSLNS